MRSNSRRWRGLCASLIVLGAGFGGSEAEAIERVEDGGLEGLACTTTCTSTVWQEADALGTASAALCANGLPDCPRFAHTGTKYLSFLGAGLEDLTVSQSAIEIPAAPATLSFWLYTELEAGLATFTVAIDGQPVFTRTADPEIDYTPFTVDVSQFAGPGTHTLSFRKVTPTIPMNPNDRFLVDDVALEAPDAPKPSNAFSFGTLKRNTSKGTAKLAVIVPGPGELALAGRRAKPAATTTSAAGEVELAVRARGKARRKLADEGSAKLRLSVTFTPSGGDPNTLSKKLKLKQR